MVRQLLADGWQVIGMSRSLPPFSQPNFRHLMVDVSQRSALLAALEQIEPPQAIIHAAGSMAAATLGNLDPQRSESLWRLHVDAAQTLVNHFAPTMGPGGRIVLLGSRTSRGAAGRSQYAATKAALVALAQELGGRAGACRGDGQRRGSRGNRYADASSARQRKFPAAASAAWATHYSAGSGLSGELVAERGRIGDDRTGAGDVWRRIAGLMLCRPGERK
ncbi:short-chain dehydrogenase/reductase SDR [Klebsiella variicola]|uniref:Short-chain dehydrogenase/reductase SDR n=1 Tax=Klebsiella variicola TaxID=244366 RepID=A0A7H4MJU6_KLEVA|nr:short-chain dehydrogenase/reductase SDR [Klebsiella variicola]